MVFKLKKPDNIAETIKMVKEQCRAVPNNGIGYGVLKEIKQDIEINRLERQRSPGILFNYLGQTDNVLNSNLAFCQANESCGLTNSKKNPPNMPLEINSMISEGQLVVNFTFGNSHLKALNIPKFAQLYEESLQRCIKHCLISKGSYTPSTIPRQNKRNPTNRQGNCHRSLGSLPVAYSVINTNRNPQSLYSTAAQACVSEPCVRIALRAGTLR